MKASDHEEKPSFVKMLMIGDSGSGKTTALQSLVYEGYRLKIIDMDNGLESLLAFVKNKAPERLDQIDYQVFRDRFKSGPSGLSIHGGATAYVKAVKALDAWDDGSAPKDWGDDTILVIDSFTKLGQAAYNWAKGLDPTAKDGRQWYFTAQTALQMVLDLLTGVDFHTNVIIISHVDMQTRSDGSMKGYASAIGSAMGPKIPQSFNTLLLAEVTGTGKNVKRKLVTLPTGLFDLKSPKPFEIAGSLPLEDGLVTVFQAIKRG